ncbi:hypothetical protein Tco_0114145, partial [Tanacetum coccineum]
YASNCTIKPRKWDAAYLQQQLQIAQKEEARIQITQEEFKFMATADAHEETKRSDNAPVYDLDGSTEVPKDKNCYDHEVQYTDLQTELDPYNDMQQKIERLQAQLGDLKGKSSDTQCASNTFVSET